MGRINYIKTMGLLMGFPQYEIAETTESMYLVIERMGHVAHCKLCDLFCLLRTGLGEWFLM